MFLVIIACLFFRHFKMKQKPKLSPSISLEAFKNHYWLKMELMVFCKDNHLSVAGSKQEITHRIEIFLATGRKIKPAPNNTGNSRDSLQPITFNTPVVSYKNDAATRQFFVEHIGSF